jgi:hypothetical protein
LHLYTCIHIICTVFILLLPFPITSPFPLVPTCPPRTCSILLFSSFVEDKRYKEKHNTFASLDFDNVDLSDTVD